MEAWQEVNPQSEQRRAVGGNIDVLPSAQSLARDVNTFNQEEIQRMLEMAMPGYSKLRDRGTQTITDFVSGRIPEDVSRAIQTRGAARATYGGFGGSGMSRNLTARDLGLTSLDLMGKGLSSAERWIQMSRTLAPTFDVTSMFLSPTFQAQFASGERDKRLGYMNTKKQFEYATDPMRKVESSVADFADVLGTALMAYMGGGIGGMGAMGAAGGGGGMMSGLGGMMGMGGGGGTSSAMQMLSGFGGMFGGGGSTYSASQPSFGGFRFNPNTGYYE